MSHYLNVTKTDNQCNNKTVIASMESMLNKLDELDALLALESQIIDNPSLEADNPLLLANARAISRQKGATTRTLSTPLRFRL